MNVKTTVFHFLLIKNSKDMKKQIFLMLLFVWIIVSPSSAANVPDKEVLKAFELRTKGKVDDSRLLLESILSKDSTNAMAHFEMARLKHYLLIGGGEVKIEDILNSINKAVSYDSQNITYAYYKAIVSFLNAYMDMESGNAEVKKRVDETCLQFEKVLSMKPDYSEASLNLVEIYGMLPKQMGGDSLKAIAWSEKLANKNDYFGSRARAVLLSKEADHVKFWMDRLDREKKNPEFLMEVGKAYLNKADPKNAEKYFDEAIKSDPSKNILLLDLARYHMMVVMQNRDLAKTDLPLAKDFIERYLTTSPEPIIPLKSYAMGLMSLNEMFLGNQSEADKWKEEATKLDKYFSRALGIPTLLLFDSPDQISHHYFSFFSPF